MKKQKKGIACLAIRLSKSDMKKLKGGSMGADQRSKCYVCVDEAFTEPCFSSDQVSAAAYCDEFYPGSTLLRVACDETCIWP